jgi:hypothetical protein
MLTNSILGEDMQDIIIRYTFIDDHRLPIRGCSTEYRMPSLLVVDTVIINNNKILKELVVTTNYLYDSTTFTTNYLYDPPHPPPPQNRTLYKFAPQHLPQTHNISAHSTTEPHNPPHNGIYRHNRNLFSPSFKIPSMMENLLKIPIHLVHRAPGCPCLAVRANIGFGIRASIDFTSCHASINKPPLQQQQKTRRSPCLPYL